MSRFAQLQLWTYKLSTWMNDNPQATGMITFSLALGLALVSAMLGHGTAFADPTGGGGSGSPK